MNSLKRYVGFLWMLIGPATIVILLVSAFNNIDAASKSDISNPIPWIIIIGIFTPIAIGLTLFGWYCVKGEYELENEIDETE